MSALSDRIRLSLKRLTDEGDSYDSVTDEIRKHITEELVARLGDLVPPRMVAAPPFHNKIEIETLRRRCEALSDELEKTARANSELAMKNSRMAEKIAKLHAELAGI